MTKKVIWCVAVSEPDKALDVTLWASWEAANAVARGALKESWGDFEEYADDKFPGDMPADHEQAIEAMQALGFYPSIIITLTHHTIETDELESP